MQVCASNVNRSMEAHALLQEKGLNVRPWPEPCNSSCAWLQPKLSCLIIMPHRLKTALGLAALSCSCSSHVSFGRAQPPTPWVKACSVGKLLGLQLAAAPSPDLLTPACKRNFSTGSVPSCMAEGPLMSTFLMTFLHSCR